MNEVLKYLIVFSILYHTISPLLLAQKEGVFNTIQIENVDAIQFPDTLKKDLVEIAEFDVKLVKFDEAFENRRGWKLRRIKKSLMNDMSTEISQLENKIKSQEKFPEKYDQSASEIKRNYDRRDALRPDSDLAKKINKDTSRQKPDLFFPYNPVVIKEQRMKLLQKQNEIYSKVKPVSLCFPGRNKEKIIRMRKILSEFRDNMESEIRISENEIRYKILKDREAPH